MFKNRLFYQYVATLSVNLITISFGTTAGWTSSNVLLLQSITETPLASGPLTTEELSWITSLMGFGAIIGTLLFGWLANVIGRKFSLCAAAVPEIISWLMIIFADNAIWLYFARFICGLSAGGVFVLIPIFISEITENSCRGALGVFLTVFANVGILLAFITGNALNFKTEAYFLLCIPVIFLIIISFFPDTPIYLLKCDKIKEAESSLAFYRNLNGKMKMDLMYLNNEMKQLREYLKKDEYYVKGDEIKLNLNDFKSKSSKKALFISLSLIAFHELCGAFIIINYTATIFKISGSNLSPYLSAITVGILQLIGTYISTLLVDKFGRKFLLIGSALGTGLGLFSLGLFLHLNSLGFNLEIFKLIPVISFSMLIFIASCGLLPIPWVIITEVLPEKIRNFGTTLCACFSWCLSFTLLKCFAPVSDLIGMHNSIYIFGIFSCIASLFAAFIIPETKGKSYGEILKLLES